MSNNKKWIRFETDKDNHRKLKLISIKEDITIQDFMDEALKDTLEDEEKRTRILKRIKK